MRLSPLPRGACPAAALLVLAGGSALLAAGGDAIDPARYLRGDLKYILLLVALVLLAAQGVGAVFRRLGKPPVVGQLLAGVVLAVVLRGLGSRFEFFSQLIGADTRAVFNLLAELGIILVLFIVGFQSRVGDLANARLSCFLVAIVGAFVPFVLGYFTYISCAGLWYQEYAQTGTLHKAGLFFGAMMAASSIGITLTTFRASGRIESAEAKFILSVAIINDVIGLVILSVLRGMGDARGQRGGEWYIGGLALLALLFVVAAMALSSYLAPQRRRRGDTARIVAAGERGARAEKMVERMASPAGMFVFIVALAFFAELLGLAAIIGSFCAGILLSGYRVQGHRERISLRQLLAPVVEVFIPMFFVRIGMELDLAQFLKAEVWALAAVVTVVAMVAKTAAGFLVFEKGVHRLTVGVSLMPRCTVALVFASIAKTAGWIGNMEFAVVVVMVLATTLLTPPLLAALLESRGTTDPTPTNSPVS